MPTAEENIYNRLSTINPFHPFSAELRADDWLLEPGDVVKIKSDNDEYNVPVYSTQLQWNGAITMNASATGNKERGPLPELRRKEFATNSAVYGHGLSIKKQEEEIDGYYQRFIEQKGLMGMIAGSTGIVLDAEGNPVIDPATGKFVYDPNSSAEVFSQLTTEPNQAKLIAAINDADGRISHARIDLDAAGTVLIDAINKRGDSSVNIRADRIVLSGKTLAEVINAIEGRFSRLLTGYEEAQVIKSQVFDCTTGLGTGTFLHLKTGSLKFADVDMQLPIMTMGDAITSSNAVRLMTGRGTSLDFNHTHSVTMTEITDSGDANVGKVKAELGGAIPTNNSSRISFFDIAASQTYINGVAAAQTISTNTAITIDVSELGSTVTKELTVANGLDNTTKQLPFNITLPPGGGGNITIMASVRESANPGGYTEIFEDAGDYMDLRNKVDGFYTFKVSCGSTDKWYGFWVGERG